MSLTLKHSLYFKMIQTELILKTVLHIQLEYNAKLPSCGSLVGMIHCVCDGLWQCCDYGMYLQRQRRKRQRRVRNGNIVFFIWHTGAAIYFDNDNTKRQRQPGIWIYNIHTHTRTHEVATLPTVLQKTSPSLSTFDCSDLVKSDWLLCMNFSFSLFFFHVLMEKYQLFSDSVVGIREWA